MKKNNNNDEKNFLLYVPEIKHKDYKVDEKNIVTMYFQHNKVSEKFARWLVKKSNISATTLDEKCSAVWLLIDGKRNIYEIALEMADEFDDTKEIAIERLVTYMRYVSKKGWIKFTEVKTLEK
ncbi:PqqD family protein [Clostridium sp.]|uniref:PqqD family protein n=1 Tax=Clostridium sp. TaxID=1506 RepID=UPI0032179BF6